MNAKNPQVFIIILNWNGWKDTIECLESVFSLEYGNFRVVVVDNGSDDNSIQKIRAYCRGDLPAESQFFEYTLKNKPISMRELTREESETQEFVRRDRLILITAEKNYGFSEGNNIGIRYALKMNADYILLLNNDTVVDSFFLTELVALAEKNKRIGISGPKIYYYNFDGRRDVIWFAGGRIRKYFLSAYNVGMKKVDSPQFNTTGCTDFVTGCAMFIRAEVLHRTGLLDVSYQLFLEDADLCVRCRNNKWKIMYNPKAVVWHKVARSTGKKVPPVYFFNRNKLLFAGKHFSPLSILAALPLYLGSTLLQTGILLAKYKSLAILKSSCQGLYHGLAFLMVGAEVS